MSDPAQSSTSRWTLPRQVGDFQVIKRIGKGGQSYVFTARQRHVERIVALKILRPDAARNGRVVADFKREAARYGACDHPNIVACYQAGQDKAWHYQALTWCERGDAIRALQGATRAKALGRVLRWIAEGAEAIGHLAMQGLVHGDVKPANLLIHGDGRALLADLGSVRPAGPDGVGQSTVGTVAYMSPEQAANAPLDLRSDLFSLGASVWHCLAGRPPREPDPDPARFLAHARETPLTDLATVAPWVPSSVRALVRRCCETDPTRRIQRPGDLASAALSVREGLTSKASEGEGAVSTMVDLTGGF
jgi:serine/threonine-protein kinase